MELVLLQGESPFLEPARKLYREAFPPLERREEMLAQKAAFRPGVLVEKGEFRGILFYWESREFLFLEHFAIAPQARNGGLGAKALALLQGLGKPIILEIEPPEDSLTCRRRGFYLRNGFLENPWPHIQPKYRPDDEPLELKLLSWPQALTRESWRRFEDFLAENVGI